MPFWGLSKPVALGFLPSALHAFPLVFDSQALQQVALHPPHPTPSHSTPPRFTPPHPVLPRLASFHLTSPESAVAKQTQAGRQVVTALTIRL